MMRKRNQRKIIIMKIMNYLILSTTNTGRQQSHLQ